ncbi:uncharacterized protein LOC119349816 isoform X3 [Triticum dicoccoides]|uniref:uncharacterized protein LOC119324399 isoform X1 n=1 Tax=Triticum dicoccoides TaxID=85692 RepID=UPI00188F4480|nr:uncharacterized protein LOC119324399 isoform X1 [Triticum dicoccoides]XP_037473804.1 uncharacterized protein LOC119349816 isoform X3 [Triticum dicoccoides]XP_044413527.1 uncharacterized protein LOC123137745 isoform X2 [Triticum aestivum]XP_044425081.1 uncharacterized protein LOC123149481 isoform X2 [Triticum aestivum]
MLHMRRIGGTPNQSEGGWAEQPDGAAMGASGEHVTCICHCWRTLPALETAVLFRRALTNQSTYEVARWKGLFYLRVILDKAHPFSKCIYRNICDFCLTME